MVKFIELTKISFFDNIYAYQRSKVFSTQQAWLELTLGPGKISRSARKNV